MQPTLALTFFILHSLFVSAHIPYLDPRNSHNSFASAFQFPDCLYSRAVCTTTNCPPPVRLSNSTSLRPRHDGRRGKRWSKQSWSKVFIPAGQDIHFEFGVPHLPALEFPTFYPTVSLIGDCIPAPSCKGFPDPKPQQIEWPSSDLPSGYHPKALQFNLADPGYQPTKFYESHLEATFLSYLNITVPVTCGGDVYIVVETNEKRIVEFYVAVGEKEGFPSFGSSMGIATTEQAKRWANGANSKVGTYCKKAGIWDRE
ncbi:hypothetical protein ABW20_dc0103995 [Dactylellina cionopaga]|nr:hypothetical protein ABW20_dc0103995 [Dactylellina cionopaga]